MRGVARKRILLARLPPALCLHLSRLMGGDKISVWIPFPLMLQLDVAPAAAQKDYSRELCKYTALRDKIAPPPKRPPRVGRGGAAKAASYMLASIVVHHGGPNSGHFTCYRRTTPLTVPVERAKWVHISDDKVVPTNVQTVLAAQAYMLLYERLPAAGAR